MIAINFQKCLSKIIEWKIIPNFYWKIARTKLSKKHFGRIAIFHLKKLLEEAPKNLKKSLGKSIQTKNHTSFIGKNTTKRNIEKTMWQNRLISKKNHYWRDVAIKVWISMPFLGLSGKFAEWKKGMPWLRRAVCCLVVLVVFACCFSSGTCYRILFCKSVDFYAFFGLLGKGRGVEKGCSSRFQNGNEENCCLI